MEYSDFDYLADSLWLSERGDVDVLAIALQHVYSDAVFLGAIPTGDHWS